MTGVARAAGVGASRRLGPACVVVHLLAGCTTWQPRPGDPGTLVEDARPARVRLTAGDGSRVILSEPTIRTDSIVGRSEEGVPAAVALEDVSGLEIRVRDASATAQAIALVGVLVIVAAQACFGLVSPCGGDA